MPVSKVNNYFMNSNNYAGHCAHSVFQEKTAEHMEVRSRRNSYQRSVSILLSEPPMFKPRICQPRPLTEDDLINCRPFRKRVKKIEGSKSASHQIRVTRSCGKRGQQVTYIHQPSSVVARVDKCFYIPPPPPSYLYAKPPPPPPPYDRRSGENDLEFARLPPPPLPPDVEDKGLEKPEIHNSLILTNNSGRIFPPSSVDSFKVARMKTAKKQREQMLPIAEEEPNATCNVMLERAALEALPKTQSPEIRPESPPPLPESSLFQLDNIEILSSCGDSLVEVERLSNGGDHEEELISSFSKIPRRISLLDVDGLKEEDIPEAPKDMLPPLPETILPKDAEG